MTHSTHIAVLLAALAAAPAISADFTDPTWPCVQRKVERLSPGLMWPHPVEEVELDPQTKAAVDDLVARLVLRRLDLAEVAPDLTRFVAAQGKDPAVLGQVFQKAFDKLARRRTTIIGGIEDYSLSQIALSERIEQTRTKMDELMSLETPDFDQVDALEEQLDWDERIYTDRSQSLSYVCETPVLLEQRIFAIAHMLLAEIEG